MDNWNSICSKGILADYNVDRTFLDFAEKEIKTQMMMLSKKPMGESEAEKLAKEVVKKLIGTIQLLCIKECHG